MPPCYGPHPHFTAEGESIRMHHPVFHLPEKRSRQADFSGVVFIYPKVLLEVFLQGRGM